jgi:hypothetical protein
LLWYRFRFFLEKYLQIPEQSVKYGQFISGCEIREKNKKGVYPNMKKILALVLALALVLSCASALAAKVGVSMPTKSLQRWNQDGSNMEAMLKEAGFEVDLQYAGDDVQQQLSQVETMINGEEGGSYIADGVIVATPTGSTGYSLSAGGPVVAPGVECMIISPVCAHSLQHCPYVVPHGAKVVFRLNPERNQQAQLQVDGRSVMTLSSGDYIHVTGAEQKLKLVRTGDYRFFHVLKTKLSEWSSLRKDEMK